MQGAANDHRTGPSRTPVGIGWRHAHYAALLEQRPALDFVEVHSENFFGDGGAALAVLAQGRGHYPVSLHGVGLSLGSADGLDEWHLTRLARLVDRIDPVRVSDHASFARTACYSPEALHAADLLPVPFTRAALDAMEANVQRVQACIRRPLLVENLSAYVQWREADMDEPTFLTALAHRTGCQLLVDVNNLVVNALNARLRGDVRDPLEACKAWIDAVPVDSVGELHVAGHVDAGDIVIDDHGSRVSPTVWAVYRHAIQRFGPVPTLVEWDTDVPALEVLLQEANGAREQSTQALQPGRDASERWRGPVSRVPA
ncbi:MAG: DUF692 domain-containing protein [Hydrogenophaga sp.]|jgi:hypothetical protein|nr:DUF692 domain-containing protein [Hydrogenophaga sp.]